jgi:glutathione synthase/RimK-type ligase-like ATP-grasp enzyme
LADLDARGVPVVPTAFVEAGDPAPRLTGDIVVKPSVGAGSSGAARFVDVAAGALAHVEALHSDGRVAMVQPHLAAVDTVGETGFVYVGGRFSHAFRKTSILAGDITWEGGWLFAREEVALA